MNELEILISLAGTILGLVLTVVTFIVKWVRSARARRGLEQAVKIGNAVQAFIREAEKFTAFSGEQKKAFVMTKANQFAIDNRIAFRENQISNKIEELVALTRQVNFRDSTVRKIEKPEIKTEEPNAEEVEPEIVEEQKAEQPAVVPVQEKEIEPKRKSWL